MSWLDRAAATRAEAGVRRGGLLFFPTDYHQPLAWRSDPRRSSFLTSSSMPKRQRTPSPRPSSSSPSKAVASNQAKKLKLLAANTLASPFPAFARPTPAECAAVHDVLAAAHPDVSPAAATDDTTAPTSAAETCGRVPDVLEALIGTHLAAPDVGDAAAMRALVAFDGVGPKTAACVLLFCLGRAAFPVDTHVFRLARLLGWVPPRADRVAAQAHLDLRVPPELKRGLHVLMVTHGRRCKGCRGKGACPLKEWLETRTGLDDEELERMSVKAEEEAEQTLPGKRKVEKEGDATVEREGELGEVNVEEESQPGDLKSEDA
ncbi:hypothetical protein PHLGIDRAFT_130345 [Phlebiopsis gigantea 11061_1 CR5-6]|uniref:HhH-GPD domain-containing protein n=1 Tax=Phlebiopsis gigantea (strain 11061_1 CR5-6) TaxID=745531 RepID=A0A0C3NEN5_PHLG1|nr:hypothetical protein PHLGIDRAFT_130345 [Phlebiopsis gigantea 11061_1 CR5-6]